MRAAPSVSGRHPKTFTVSDICSAANWSLLNGPRRGAGGSPNGDYGMSGRPNLLRLDVGPPDYLCPLCRIFRDELLEVGGRAAKPRASLLDKPGLDNGIGDSGVDLPVELFNDLGGHAPRRANSIPCTRLIARYEIAHGWDVRQCLQADRRGHRHGSYLARADVLNRCACA